jgi:hypothetical protein
VPFLKWSTVILSVLQGGYMVFDGARALVVGAYVTPGSGEQAGQLGPWARLVSLVGVEPESTGMKLAFVVLGVLWLILGLGVALATLWYLVAGTVVSVAVLVLLLTPQMRRALGRELTPGPV